MGNQRGKGLTYFLVFIGLLLGGALTLVTILMLSPGKEIGGYTFINENVNGFSVLGEFANEEFSDVYIDSGFYRVIVTERDEISPTIPFNLMYTSNLIGIAKYDTYQTEYNIAIEDGDLYFSFTKLPAGLLFSKDSCELNLITYKNHAMWHTSTINIKTTSGNVVIGGPNVGNVVSEQLLLGGINVETETGSISLTQKFDTASDASVVIKTVSGTVYLQNNLTASQISVENTSGNVFVSENKTLTANIVTKGNTAQFKMFNIIGNVSIENTSGMWTANIATGDVVCAETLKMTDITIQEVTGIFHLSAATSANITLLKAGGNVTVNTQSGSVAISNASSFVDVDATSGNVVLKFVSSEIEANTTTGNITVEYKEGIESCAEANIATQRGVVNVSNAVGTVNINATETGSVNISFVRVNGESNITTNSGAITSQISIVAQNQFIIETQSGKSVSVNLGAYIRQDKAFNSQIINDYTGSDNNVSFISNSGAVQVLSYV